MSSYTFTLDKKASKSGADKYTLDDPLWIPYIPQSLSRKHTVEPLPTITLTLSPQGNTKFTLKLTAKKSGGDRYTTSDHGGFDMYIPQSVSRQDGGNPLDVICMDIGS